jgi:hypothetical protein
MAFSPRADALFEYKYRLLEPYAMKVACTVLTGGKLERAYLSEFGRGLYYGSYQNPRTLVWSIGVVIFILMMAINAYHTLVEFNIYNLNLTLNIVAVSTSSGRIKACPWRCLPPEEARSSGAINRIGPHSKEVLSYIVGGLLGDWWVDKIPGKTLPSVRFNVEESISNGGGIYSFSCPETLFSWLLFTSWT